MNRRTRLVGIAVALGMLMGTHTASAQVVHMNTKTRVFLFKEIVKGIKKRVAKGKSGEAKVMCLVGFHIIKNSLRVPRFAQRNRAALQGYNSVCNPLYKDHKGDPAGFAAVVAQYKEKITEYGRALAFPPFGKAATDSAGYLSPYKRYKRMVEAPLISDKAEAHAVEFVGKLPTLNIVLSKPVPKFDLLLANLMEIMTGGAMAKQLLKKKGISGIIAEADKQIAAFRPTWHPDRITQDAVSVGKWIALLKQAAPNHAKIPLWATAIKKMKVAADKRWKAFVAKRRMPKSTYGGKGKARLLKLIRATYTASYGKWDKVARVVINTPNWTVPRGEGYWYKKRWYWKVYSKLSPITVAVEQKKDKGKKTYQLFQVELLRERRGSGWGKPYMVGRTIPVGPILKKNVNK